MCIRFHTMFISCYTMFIRLFMVFARCCMFFRRFLKDCLRCSYDLSTLLFGFICVFNMFVYECQTDFLMCLYDCPIPSLFFFDDWNECGGRRQSFRKTRLSCWVERRRKLGPLSAAVFALAKSFAWFRLCGSEQLTGWCSRNGRTKQRQRLAT